MQLSTKSRYASRALIELALQYGGDPVKLKDIANRQDISLKYLEQVMFPLRVSGYVKTQKGSKGGYHLARSPEAITLLEIVESVEGSISPVECAKNPHYCERADKCPTHFAWVGLKEAIEKELGKTTLANLVEKYKNLNARK